MIPVSTTTCAVIDASTTRCVTAMPSSASGTPAVLWQYDAGQLVISFLLAALLIVAIFQPFFYVRK